MKGVYSQPDNILGQAAQQASPLFLSDYISFHIPCTQETMENWFMVYISEVSLTERLNLIITYPYRSLVDASNSVFLNAPDKAILFAFATVL